MPPKRRAVSGSRGKPAAAAPAGTGRKRRRAGDSDLLQWSNDRDEDVSSDEEEQDGAARERGGGGSEGEDSDAEREKNETAEEKRLRLAHDYLAKLGGEEAGEDHSEDGSSGGEEQSEGEDGVINRGRSGKRLSRRLQTERLAARGQLRRALASRLEAALSAEPSSSLVPEEQEHSADRSSKVVEERSTTRWLSGHDLPVTCIALSGDDATVYSGGKDNAILRYDVETGARSVLCPRWKARLPGGGKAARAAHCAEVLALAASTDGRYVAAGGRDRLVRVWDCRAPGGGGGDGPALVASFTGHRDAVSALAFRHGTYSLYSGSHDRSLKHWSLAELAYVETLFGHQGEVNALDAFRRERAVSGARDGTARAWKILEETHLVFRAPGRGAVDAVACVDDDVFLSGGSDGALSLWSALRKKPLATVPAAHGGGAEARSAAAAAAAAAARSPPWICSLAAVRSSDLAVSGSSDGFVRVWRVDVAARALSQVGRVCVPGFVNGLCVASGGRFAVAAVGQEHRLGRWERQARARNRVAFVPLMQRVSGWEEGDGGGGDDE